MQIQENSGLSQIDLEKKHDLLGKYGFDVPQINNFSIIKVVDSIELENIKITSNKKPNYLVYSKDSKLSGNIHIRFIKKAENNCFFLGNNVHIENGKFKFLGNNSTVIIGNDNKHYGSTNSCIWNSDNLIFLGANTTSNGLNLRAKSSNIIIGDDCMIATDVWIRNSDEHLIFDLSSLETINSSGEVIIYPHTWICQDVVILKNTKIGPGSIIGAKSLITKNVPSFSVVGGNPAKIIKTNVSWERRGSKIQKSTLQKINNYKIYDTSQ